MTEQIQEQILMDELIALKQRVADLEESIQILRGALTVAGTGRPVAVEFPPEQLRISDIDAGTINRHMR